MDVLWLTLQDTLDLLKATQVRDLMTPFFAAFWLIILIMPLYRVDRRDWVTFLVYALYMLAAGATLLIVIPSLLVEETFSASKYFMFILCLLALITGRWLIVRKAARVGK